MADVFTRPWSIPSHLRRLSTQRAHFGQTCWRPKNIRFWPAIFDYTEFGQRNFLVALKRISMEFRSNVDKASPLSPI